MKPISLYRQFIADVDLYHRLRYGARARTAATTLGTLVLNRGLWIVLFHRVAFSNACRYRRFGPSWWLSRLVRVFGKFYIAVVGKSDFRIECELRPGVFLSNKGYLTIGAESIGSGSLIHDRCTFGYAITDRTTSAPVVGDNVWIGPDCVVIGALTIGTGATLLPGSVVSFSVPPHAVVAGNPARIVLGHHDNTPLRGSFAVVDAVPNQADHGQPLR
jgi:serine acetyltransferase